MIAIGIGGPSYVGKDEAAKRLVDRWGFHSKAFSELIVEEFQEVFGRQPTKGEMQDYGTERRERKGEWYWVKKMAEWARPLDRIVLPGVRFPQELEWIQRQRAWALWRVESSKLVDPTGRNPNHTTETSLDGFDGWSAVIRNDAEVLDLHINVDAALAEWAGQRTQMQAPESKGSLHH